MRSIALAAMLAAAVACAPAVTTTTTVPVAVAVTPVVLPPGAQWGGGPPFLPAGVRLAVLDGDPGKEGIFTVRLWMPNDYRVPPHTHPAFEHVTIVSGVLHLGMGNTFTMNGADELRQGAFRAIGPNMPHFVHAAGETVVQIHGMGPFSIKYVNAADDPRSR